MKKLYLVHWIGNRIWGTLLIFSTVCLIISLCGIVIGYAVLPSEVEQDVALVNYEHRGQYNFTVHQKPSYLFGPEPEESLPLLANPRYPTEIVNNIIVSFSYETADVKRQPVEVYAVLENPGIWTKKVTLVPEADMDGEFIVTFPMNVAELDQVFNTIDKETGIVSSQRTVTVTAHVGETSGEFYLPIDLGRSIIEVDNNLVQTTTASHGKFDYVVNLKENSLYDADTLQPSSVESPVSVDAPLPKEVGQGEIIFSRLVDSIDATFSYSLISDQSVDDLQG